MMLLRANGIIQDYADRRVLDSVDINIYDGDRIGLVGENGAGKSTLMKILAGRLNPDEGSVKCDCPVALVEQFGAGGDDAITGEMSSRFNAQENRSGLSGGECTRRRIAQALGASPRLLMLDEPTTDLDAQGIEELMRELGGFDGAILLISHDRAFLDALCTSIAELEDGRVTLYPGNYSDYAAEKQRRRDFQQFEFDEYRRERARLTAAIDARQRRASKSKLPSRMGNSEARLHKRSATETEEKLHDAANALKSRLDRLEKKERPREEVSIRIRLGASGGVTSRLAASCAGLRLAPGGHTLLEHASFVLPTGARTALIGPNGCGKTSLIRRNLAGDGVKVSPGVRIGYFGQNHEEVLDTEKTVLENVMRASVFPESDVRTVLANLNIRADDVFKPVKVLSGGERAKTSLASLLVSDANFLILDEPTNHLDIFSLEALERVLRLYEGTLLFVSHDRMFVREVASRLIFFENRRLTTFDGTVDAWQAEQEKRAAGQDAQARMLRITSLEMRLAGIAARLSAPKKGDSPDRLNEEYLAVAEELRKAKNS